MLNVKCRGDEWWGKGKEVVTRGQRGLLCCLLELSDISATGLRNVEGKRVSGVEGQCGTPSCRRSMSG